MELKTIDQIKQILSKTVEKVMTSSFGFSKSEVEDLSVVEVKQNGNEIIAEVRAELGYDAMLILMEACDIAIQEYDPDAYFDMEAPGIIQAYIRNFEISFKVSEAMDVDSFWDLYLKKLSNKDAEKILEDNSVSLPAGIVTDGRGNLYKIPDEGVTPLFSFDGNIEYKFRYNWGSHEIELYSIFDLGSIDDDEADYIYLNSYSLSPENFIDNPEYWFNVALEENRDFIDSQIEDFKAAEAIEVFGEIIDDDKEVYSYMIKNEVVILPAKDDYSNIGIYENSITDKTKQYNKTIKMFGEVININLVFDEMSWMLDIYVNFNLPLTKEELLEIYDDLKDEIVNFVSEKGKYTVELNLIDIMEV